LKLFVLANEVCFDDEISGVQITTAYITMNSFVARDNEKSLLEIEYKITTIVDKIQKKL